MIYLDEHYSSARGRFSHLFSDKIGLGGEVELLEFAKRIGLRLCWIQCGGTLKVHFDLYGSKIEDAIEAGALQVDRAGYRKIYLRKKQQLAEAQRSTQKKKE